MLTMLPNNSVVVAAGAVADAAAAGVAAGAETGELPNGPATR